MGDIDTLKDKSKGKGQNVENKFRLFKFCSGE